MSQPLTSPKVKRAHGLPSHPHRRKVSAPQPLKSHLEGTQSPSPTGRKISSPHMVKSNLEGTRVSSPTPSTQRKFNFTRGPNGEVYLPSTSSSGSHVNSITTPNSTGDDIQNFSAGTFKDTDQLQSHSNDFGPHDEVGLINEGYVTCGSPSSFAQTTISNEDTRAQALIGSGVTSSEGLQRVNSQDLTLPVMVNPEGITSSENLQRINHQDVVPTAGVPLSEKMHKVSFEADVPPAAVSPVGVTRSESIQRVNSQNEVAPVRVRQTLGPRSVSSASLMSNRYSTQLSDYDDSQSVFTEVGTPSTCTAGNRNGSSNGSLPMLLNELIIREEEEPQSEYNANEHKQQIVSPSTEADIHVPRGTEPAERKKWLVTRLSTSLCIVYILLMIVIGVVCYLLDMFAGSYSIISESFNIYIMTVQLIWLAYVHLSVRRYISQIARLNKDIEDEADKQRSQDLQNKPNNDQQKTRVDIPQHYGFTFSSHGGSLYLKIGAAVFCIGNLILTGLQLGSNFQYILHEDQSYQDCTSVTAIVMLIMKLNFSFYQLFFAFKFSNLIINKRLLLAKFGIMHCIGSSLCFWIYTIIQETIHSLDSKSDHGDDSDENYTVIHAYAESGESPSVVKAAGSLYLGCHKSTPIADIIHDAAPYLYPFSIEFNILIVGFWILLWENLGKMEKHNHIPSIEVRYEEDDSKALASNLIIYVDCHASSRGLFAGLLVTIGAIISIILYFVYTSSDNTLDEGLLINSVSELLILSIMFIATIGTFYYIRDLDVLTHSISSADDILLYICLPCVFLYALITLVPYAFANYTLFVLVNVLKVLQVILQTALIVDGLRRCSNTNYLQHHKPGREGIIFLVVMNVAMWLVMSFQIISVDGNALLYDFYGKEVWTTVSHLTLPLALFYRFHSSVCLVDVWTAAYDQEHTH